MTSYPIIPLHPLQRLYDLDKASPQFHEELRNFFHGNLYRILLPSLRGEGLAWLVEYLDSVRFKIIFLYAMLITNKGSRRCFRSRRARFQRIVE